MQSNEFEHILAAAAAATGEAEFVVIGSQAILGSVATPPPALLVSMEVDIYPRYAPEAALQIDGSLGDGSPFHNSFGYYAHGEILFARTSDLPITAQERKPVEKMLRTIVRSLDVDEPSTGRGAHS